MLSNKSTVSLINALVLALVIMGLSVYMLRNSDAEIKRLLELEKLWTGKDITMRLQQVRRRNFLIGYWFFLLFSSCIFFLLAFALIGRVTI